jgi:hypothetical protein
LDNSVSEAVTSLFENKEIPSVPKMHFLKETPTVYEAVSPIYKDR